MATSIADLSPLSAEFPTTNAPGLTTINTRPCLAFDAATKETCYWTFRMPQGVSSALTLIVHIIMASATSNKVDFEVAVEAVTPGDAFDLDAGNSFDTVNTGTAPTVPATAGYLFTMSITLTNADSYAAGDQIRISLARDAADGTNDTAAGDAYVTGCDLQAA